MHEPDQDSDTVKRPSIIVLTLFAMVYMAAMTTALFATLNVTEESKLERQIANNNEVLAVILDIPIDDLEVQDHLDRIETWTNRTPDAAVRLANDLGTHRFQDNSVICVETEREVKVVLRTFWDGEYTYQDIENANPTLLKEGTALCEEVLDDHS